MTFKEYFGNSKTLLWLIGTNMAVALVIATVTLVSPHTDLAGWLTVPADAAGFIRRPWSLVTYMFTQTSFLHLLFNMLWLLWFGRIFLYCSSPKRLLAAYIGGGLTGAVLFIIVCAILDDFAGSYLIGSSAAVLAVMTAAAYMAPNLELNMLLLGRVRLKYVALLCIVLTFIGIGGGNAGGLSAHAGGVLFGLLLPSVSSSNSRFVSRSFLPSFSELRRRLLKSSRSKRRQVPSALADSETRRPLSGRLSDEERLDQLLDKVRKSGYNSLSDAEKRELNAISQRL